MKISSAASDVNLAKTPLPQAAELHDIISNNKI